MGCDDTDVPVSGRLTRPAGTYSFGPALTLAGVAILLLQPMRGFRQKQG
jgi:hypothetical protein